MKKVEIIITVLLIVTLSALWYIEHREHTTTALRQNAYVPKGVDAVRFYFLDIGQGDATLIIFPNGEKMLVDCGKDGRILPALGRTLPFYDNTIDYLLTTHPDLDHYGGCIDVLKRFSVKHVITNGYQKDGSGTFQSFWQAVQDEHADYHQVNMAETMIVASTTIDVLYPDHDVTIDPLIPGFPNKSESNGTSIILRLTYGDEKVLMTGDMEADLEAYLLKKLGPNALNVDILKVGHHGSPGSSSQEFVNAVTPQYAMISVGKENMYGHPSLRVMKRLERGRASVWRTDERGDILAGVTTSSIYVSSAQ